MELRIPFEKCPLCDGTDSFEVMVGDSTTSPTYKPPLPAKQRWLQCGSCNHVYVDGYFSSVGLSLLFSDAQTGQTPGHDIENSRYVSARMLDNLWALAPSQSGRWLDVGFGNGALMSTAAEFGYEVVGLDLREANVQAMRAFGFEAHAVDLEDYNPSEPFDVISMADVLEHIPFPRRALTHAFGLLRDGGLLFLSMPNSDSFLWQVLSRNGVNPYWGEIEHLHNFGRKRLYSLLEECGFSPARYMVSFRYRACMEVVAKKLSKS